MREHISGQYDAELDALRHQEHPTHFNVALALAMVDQL